MVKEFLASDETEINQDLQDVLRMLKTSSKTFEIGMLLNDIENENRQINDIQYRLEQANPQDMSYTLQRLKQEELISREVMEKLLEKPYTLLEVIDLSKNTKSGAGVSQYLPSSLEEMLEKLEVMAG